jgi:hypothetical protein
MGKPEVLTQIKGMSAEQEAEFITWISAQLKYWQLNPAPRLHELVEATANNHGYTVKHG